MNFLNNKILKNLYILNYLLIFFFFLYSIYTLRYQYDGHHIGLIYSNSIDLIKGKLPYKEIFIQYGFLTTLINSIILLLFDNKVFFISFFNIIFYSLGILFVSKTINNLVNKNYALIATIVILFNHPIPWLPWSNYITFFFISISLFLLSNKKSYFFLISFFLSLAVLSRQDCFIAVLFSFTFFSIFYLFGQNKINFKFVFKIFSGFFLPIIFFLLYLFFLNIYREWNNYLLIPNFYLDLHNTSVIDLVFNYFVFFTSNSFFDFIHNPQFFLISIILICNSILILLKIFNKIKIPNNIFMIVLLSIFLSSLSIQIELFRLYTSVIFGLIPLLYFLSKIKENELNRNLKLLIILPSIYSFVFYPMGNNDQFKKLMFGALKAELNNNQYDYFKWPKTKVNTINLINDLVKRCNVEYLDNLTFDSLLSTIGNHDRIRLLPYEKASLKNAKFHTFIDSIKNPNLNFIELINKQIQKQNIILLINENNNIYKNNKIKFTSSYNKVEINESDIVGKPKILKIYFPSKCQS